MAGWGAIYNDVAYSLSQQTQQMTTLQNEASSGERVSQASDDPAAAFTILRLQEQQARSASYTNNLNSVQTNLQTCDTALQSASSVILQAQQLLSQVSGGTYTADQHSSLAEEVNSLLEESVTLANTQGAAGYVFGGDQTGSAPYVAQRDASGQITSVQYQGASSASGVPVAGGVQQYSQMVGQDVFGADQRQAPVFLGNTGAQPGSGTSSLRGDAWLTAAHTSTTYDAGSQVAAGTSSASGDTILGAHTVTISAADHTIQLDDGPAVSFTGSETDLQLQNSAGDSAYVNMTGWTTADGQFDLQSNGTLSLDDGATTTPITASGNLAVTDSRSGQMLYVDTTGLTRTGQQAVSVPGTHDLFGVLIDIRDALANPKGLSTDEQTQLLAQAGTDIQEVSSQVSRSDTAVGGRLKGLSDLQTSLSDSSALAQQQADTLQSADITQVSVDLTRDQNLYEMTLASAARMLNLSILNYMTTS